MAQLRPRRMPWLWDDAWDDGHGRYETRNACSGQSYDGYDDDEYDEYVTWSFTYDELWASIMSCQPLTKIPYIIVYLPRALVDSQFGSVEHLYEKSTLWNLEHQQLVLNGVHVHGNPRLAQEIIAPLSRSLFWFQPASQFGRPAGFQPRK